MSPEPANPTLQVHGQSIHALNEKRCSDEREDENINRLRRLGLLEGGDQRPKAGRFTPRERGVGSIGMRCGAAVAGGDDEFRLSESAAAKLIAYEIEARAEEARVV